MKATAGLLLLLSFLALSPAEAQRISGIVTDAESGQPLQFANVWVENSNRGTTTDRHGRFTLELKAGTHTLVSSYIGYDSDRRGISVPLRDSLRITLKQSAIAFPEVTVTPGDNPALRIIRNAIEAKERWREKLDNYSLTSHSKIVLDMTGVPGMDGDGSSVSVSTDGSGAPDTAKKALTAVLETQTQAIWAKPDRYKETVLARKQSSFIPSQANILISAFFIIDFSSDALRFSERTIDGPISEAGLSSYYYRLTGTTSIDGKKIHMIDISPLNESEALLEGTLYIADGSWELMMVDVRLNEAAMPTFFDTLAFKQHFRLFDGEFWMPVDVVIDASVRIPIVNITLGIEGFSVLQDYVINQKINEDVFDRTVIKVLKEADDRDSTYWAEHQKIPNTMKEVEAYRVADSVKAVIDSTRNDYGVMDVLTGKTFSWDETSLTVPGILETYRFNRIEGHAFYASVTASNLGEYLSYAGGFAGYGIDDGRFKYDVGAAVTLHDSPRLQVGASGFDEMGSVTKDHDQYGPFLTTLTSLTGKSDYKDYFYRRGWNAWFSYDLFMLFPFSVAVQQNTDVSALTNTQWSLFRQSASWRDNPPVNEGDMFSVSATVRLDNRDFIDNAGTIMRMGSTDHLPRLSARWTSADLGGESFSFATYSLNLDGSFGLGWFGRLTYSLSGTLGDGKLPTQSLLLLHGTMPWLTGSRRFRTLDYREFGGDRLGAIFLEHNFRDAFFRWTHLPLLRDSGWGVRIFGATGWTDMTDATRALQLTDVADARIPFYEAGFGIDIGSFFAVDFAWRLNHFRDGRNFYIGFSTDLLR